MSRLSEKVAIVTGASKGIGAGITTALGAAGARVAVNYSSDKEGAERVAQTIIDNGGEAIAVGADVSKAADVARLFKEVHSAFGRLEVLVNNAGVFRFGALPEITEESFHLHYNINVLGTILTVQEAIMRFGADGGSIINLSSIVGSHPVAGALLYASTKGELSSVISATAPKRNTPALLTRTSSFPNAESTSLNSRATSAALDTSAPTAIASPPFSMTVLPVRGESLDSLVKFLA